MRRAISAQNRRLRVSTALLAVGIVQLMLASCSSSNPGPSPDDATRDAELTQAITQAWHTTAAPGVVVGIWTSGRTPYVQAFGTSDATTNRPMATNLFMRIGSVTKTFTVTAVLQLVDKGVVGLDDPIAKYIPDVPGGDKVTVRDLADMRSGLPSYSKNDAWVENWMANPTAPWTPQQLLAAAYAVPPLFAPGTSFDYSNTNTVLLGLLVEQVTHQSLAQYIQQRILVPEHLTHTSFPSGAEFPSPHAQGYTNQTPSGALATATDWDSSWGWAAGAMISTVQDMGTWAKALATGALLSRQTQAARLMFPDLTNRAGYGVGITTVNGWLGHSGSIPGYQTLVVFEPQTQTSMVVMVNADIPPGGKTPRDVIGEAISRVITPDHVFTKESQDK